MPDMDTNEPAPEFRMIGDALAPMMERLKARGYDPDADAGDSEDLRTETREEAAERRRRRLSAFATRWQEKVPAMYRDAALADLDDHQHAVRVQSWLHSGSLHLVLAGPVGTGKTHAAYAVGNAALAAGRWVEAWSVGDLLDSLRPGSSDRGAESRARQCHVLLLDDLTAKATDWESERLTLLLDARVRDQLQTIVTTNITSDQITDTWGARFMDRLRYRLTALTFSGESRRSAAW